MIVQIKGSSDKLELRPLRSPASEDVSRRAVAAAAARSVLGPSTQHLLIALGEQELATRILGDEPLNARGTSPVFAGMKDRVRRKIDRYGLTRTINPRHLFAAVTAAVTAFRERDCR